MKSEVFEKGMTILSEVFPKRHFNPAIYWKALRDLKDTDFERAVMSVITEVKTLYPDDNLIAILIEKSEEAARIRLERFRRDTRKITDETSVPPPLEWLEAKKKLGIK